MIPKFLIFWFLLKGFTPKTFYVDKHIYFGLVILLESITLGVKNIKTSLIWDCYSSYIKTNKFYIIIMHVFSYFHAIMFDIFLLIY